MRAFTRNVLAVGAALAALIAPSISHAKELILKVGNEEQRRLLGPTNYGLRGQLYFAKRFSLIKVDFSALDGIDPKLTISPFADLKMHAEGKIDPKYQSGQLRAWKGELTEPAWGPMFDEQGRAARVPRPSVVLWINDGDHEVPVELINEIASQKRAESGAPSLLPDVSGAPKATADQRVTTKLKLKTLNGSWFVPSLQTYVVIQPVEDDPRFHVIYEQDTDKVPGSSHAEDEGTKRKLEQRNEFMKQLEEEKARARAPQGTR